MSHDQKLDEISHEGFPSNLDSDHSRIVVPVGISWLDAEKDEKPSSPRLRDILPEALMRPTGAFRQRRLLKRAPKRCALVAGERGSIKFLKTRFQTSEQSHDTNTCFNDFVARQAALTIERDSRNVPGAGMKLPRFFRASLWARRDFQEQLQNYSKSSGRPISEVREEAQEYLKELVPTPSPFFVKLMGAISSFVYRTAYEDAIVVDPESLGKLRELVREYPCALLWTHKTHVDGPALMSLTLESGFPLVHTIGGVNMAFLGLGQVARRAGAIFIRRSFQDNDLYKIVLRRYLGYVLEKRFPLTWALEGTRSRNGKLMPPRYGILKYVLEGAQKTGADDLRLVPVSIYYDLIPEISDYAAEQGGQTKRKESLAWFVQYVAGMRKPHGRVFVSIGEPVVADLTDNTVSALPDGASQDTVEQVSKANFDRVLQKTAFQAAVNSNAVTPLTSSGLIAFILAAASPKSLSIDEIDAEMDVLLDWAKARNLPLTDDFKDLSREQVRHVAASMINLGILTRYDEGPDLIYGVAPEQYFVVSYYRNTVIHFLVNNALIELALVKAAESDAESAWDAFWSEALELRDTFKFEFFYPGTEEFKSLLRVELSKQDPHWESKVRAGGQTCYALLSSMRPLVSHGVLRSFADAYRVVASALVRLKPGDQVDEKTVVAQSLKLGRQAFLRGQIKREDAIAKLLLSNGYKVALSSGCIDGEGDLAGRRLALARKMRDICNRIEVIDAIAIQQRSTPEFGVRSVSDMANGQAQGGGVVVEHAAAVRQKNMS